MRHRVIGPAGYLAVGGLIGIAVLFATALAARPRNDLPPLERTALHGGRAELRLAPRTSSVLVFDERLYPTEQLAPASRDATESRRWAGVGAGVATTVLPGPVASPLPVSVSVSAREPTLRRADDHVVDVDLLVESGRLVVIGTGSIVGHSVAVPPGRYRVRFAGTGYRLWQCADRLRIELWPRGADSPPRVRRRWPGWTP